MKQKTITVLFFMLCAGLLMQCKKEPTGLDKELLDRSKATTGFTYYKNDNTIMHSSPQSAHNAFFRVRFNAIAQAALTDNGKLPVDSVFPEGSLIVKELYDTQNGALKILAVSEKATGNSASGANWLWAEYTGDGKVSYSVQKNGSGCTGCHSTDARDYSRLFNLFP